MKTRSLTPLLLGVALTPAILHAQQTPPKVGGDNGATAFADINEQRTKPTERGFAIEAPDFVAIPDTNYPIPNGAIFAAPGGKGDGKNAQRAASIERALELAPEGATVVLAGGDYRVGSLNVKKRLTIQPAPGAKAWLLGTDIVSGWVKDGAHFRHDGWDIKLAPGTNAQDMDPNFPLSNRREMMFLDGRALGQVATREELKPGRFWVGEAGTLFLGDDPSGKRVEATARGTGMNIPVEGAIVRGLGFRGYADRGAGVNGRGVTLEKNAFVWNAIDGARMWNTDGVVRGNVFACNGKTGFGTWKAHRIVFDDNTCAYNNVEGARKAWSAAGVKFGHTKEIKARGNTMEGNNAFGMWLDVACDDSIMVRNIARGNTVSGLFFEISKGCVIAFNTAYRNRGGGIHISNSHDVWIYNNTLVDNDQGIFLQQGARKNNPASALSEGITIANTPVEGTFTTRNVQIKNNVFARLRNSKSPLWTIKLGGQAPALRMPSLMVTALDSNFYQRTAPDVALLEWSPDGEKTSGQTDLAAFSATSGLERGSFALTGAELPFVNANGGDFRFKPGFTPKVKAAPLPPEVAKAAGVNAAINYIGAIAP